MAQMSAKRTSQIITNVGIKWSLDTVTPNRVVKVIMKHSVRGARGLKGICAKSTSRLKTIVTISHAHELSTERNIQVYKPA